MKKRIISILSAFLIFLCMSSSVAAAGYPSSYNGYDRLLMPTQITKIGNVYYIVDTLHGQVIYSDSPGKKLREWKLLANGMNNPHAIDGDGQTFAVVDTDNHAVRFFEKRTDRYDEVKRFDHVGVRPHYVRYVPEEAAFYVWSSLTGEMYIYVRDASGSVILAEVRSLPELSGSYARSFTITGDTILIPVVEKSCIYEVDRYSFKKKRTYKVPPEIAGMVQVVPVNGEYLMTVNSDIAYDQSKSAFIRFNRLSDLANGGYTRITEGLDGGIRYYMSFFDGSMYVANEGTSTGAYRFEMNDGHPGRCYPMFR